MNLGKAVGSLLVFTTVVAAGCGLLTSDDDAQIVLGRNIEGVEIGDDTTGVIRKLGRPDAVFLLRYSDGGVASITMISP